MSTRSRLPRRQPELLLALDAVQHRELVGRRRHLVRGNPRVQAIGERDVVGRDVQQHAGRLRLLDISRMHNL